MTGKLITLEGVEGAGKSSQVPHLKMLLETAGKTVLTTREPGGTPLAEAIRSVLLDGDDMPAMTELLLMFAARSSHYCEKIKPALTAGTWVICDRFIDASYAYQGAARGIDDRHIQALEQMTLEGKQADLTLIFDIPVELGFERTRSRGQQNRFDQENVAFMQKVRDAYRTRAALAPNRYRIIDASQDMSSVKTQLNEVFAKLLG